MAVEGLKEHRIVYSCNVCGIGAGLSPSSTTITKGLKGLTGISWVVTLPPIRSLSDKGTPRQT
jgi:hypothetical protein